MAVAGWQRTEMALEHREQPLQLGPQPATGIAAVDPITHQFLLDPGALVAGVGQTQQQIHIFGMLQAFIEAAHGQHGLAADGPGAGQHRFVLQALAPGEAGLLLPGPHGVLPVPLGITAPPTAVGMAEFRSLIQQR